MDLTDALDQIGAVQRGLGSLEHRGKPARALTAERTYGATATDVWDALTNPERLPRWFLPVEGDLRLGWPVPAQGQRGWHDRALRPAARARRVLGVRRRHQLGRGRPERVRRRHHAGAAPHAADAPTSTGSATGQAPSGSAGTSRCSGCAPRGGGETVDPAAFEAWRQSDDGRDFMTRSSDAWRDADVAGGTDPADARDARRPDPRLLHRRGRAGLTCTPSTSSATRSGAGSWSC